jgi:hypothetical protein
MSNSKTAIAEIKKLMKQFGFLADDATLKSFKLEDNTILQVSELKAGEKIVKINDAFEQVVLENGKFRLVENFEIEVENGEIKSVKEIFVDAKLADGTVVKVEGDNLMEGAKVLVVTADAEIPAPDGVHELEDGTKIETKDGVIVKVEEVAGDVEKGEVPEAPEMEMAVDSANPNMEPPAIDEPATEGKPVPEVEVELMSLLKDFIEKCSQKMGSLEKKMEGVESQFAAFKKEPAAKKIANGKTEKFNNVSSDDLDDKISMIMAMRNTNK